MKEPDECPNCHFGQCEIVTVGLTNIKSAVYCCACELRGPTGETEDEALQAWSDLPRRSSKREPIEIVHRFSFDKDKLIFKIDELIRRFYRIKKDPHP